MRVEGDMPETGDQPNPPKPVRTWRPMVAWTLGILAALGLAWVVGAVAVPLWQVRRAMLTSDEIESLGGARAAARKLCLYIRMPEWLAPERKRAVYLLEKCNPDNVPEWIILLDDRDPSVRWLAADTLEEIAAPEAVAPLVAALKERDPSVRLAIIRALGTLGSPQAVEPLVNVLRKDEADCRRMAAYALGCIGPAARDAAPALEEALKAQDENIRAAAAEALEKIRQEGKAKE